MIKSITMKQLAILLLIGLSGCVGTKKVWHSGQISNNQPHTLEEVAFFDQARNRLIPVAIYALSGSKPQKQPVVIFSHGYGENSPKSNLAYAYLTENLARNGYFVASIQHELPTDELLPSEGIPQLVRKPNWERGSETIRFVLQTLQGNYLHLDYSRLIVMGHSNGGDMTVLFTKKYPELAYKLITLDQRRMPFPRTSQPKTYSIRSSDQPADEGVLPTQQEQDSLGITIVKLNNTIHNHMDNHANETQRKEINEFIMRFLNDE